MYSPKVSEDFVPQLYKLAKEQNKTMTRVLDDIIRDKLAEKVENKPITSESTFIPKIKSKVA